MGVHPQFSRQYEALESSTVVEYSTLYLLSTRDRVPHAQHTVYSTVDSTAGRIKGQTITVNVNLIYCTYISTTVLKLRVLYCLSQASKQNAFFLFSSSFWRTQRGSFVERSMDIVTDFDFFPLTLLSVFSVDLL
jgi:hypothetical protein